MSIRFCIPFLLTIFAFFLSGCAVPKATTEALLHQGLWLSFIDNNNRAYVINSDGTGLTSLAPERLVKSIISSSASNRIAVLTYTDENISTYSLSLIELPGTNIYKSIPLFSFFDEQSKEISGDSTISFWDALENVHWSPNGRYLAFVAAFESRIPALYVYDAIEDITKKLGQNEFQVDNLIWSRDGNWIIYDEISDFHGSQTESVWAVSPTTGETRFLYTPTNPIQQKKLGWVGDDQFIVTDRSSAGLSNIRMVDISTGIIKEVFSGYYFDAAIDTKNGSVAILSFHGFPGEGFLLESGIYLASTKNDTLKLIIPSDQPISVRWNSKIEAFESNMACNNTSEEVLIFNSVGETNCAQRQKGYSAADNNWYVLINDEVDIYNGVNGKVGEIPERAKSIIWRPDSQGFFFFTKDSLFYASLPKTTYSEICSGNYFGFAWAGIP